VDGTAEVGGEIMWVKQGTERNWIPINKGDIICLNCGKVFKKKAGSQKFCSKECRSKKRLSRKREATRERTKTVDGLMKWTSYFFKSAHKNKSYSWLEHKYCKLVAQIRTCEMLMKEHKEAPDRITNKKSIKT